MYLIFDTETTGIPRLKNAPITDLENWPRVVQLAWQLHDKTGKLLSQHNCIIQPDGFDIPFKAEQVHGISTERAQREGRALKDVLARFGEDLLNADALVGHNLDFDIPVVGAECVRQGLAHDRLLSLEHIDTAKASIAYCQLPGGPGGKLKMPKLSELYHKLFGTSFDHAHDAFHDVNATARSFFRLMQESIITPHPSVSVGDINYEGPAVREESSRTGTTASAPPATDTAPPTPAAQKAASISSAFSHLHTHSQFSVLQATPSIPALLDKAQACGMSAVGLTDLGNMYGAFHFVTEAISRHIKPIVGCEVFIAEERKKLKFTKAQPDRRYRQVLLAKNKAGYLNLVKLCSLGFTEGLYGNYPRIDKALIETHRRGLIATTGGLSGEIPHLILYVGERQAEEAFRRWHDIFQDDFYAELNRHGLPEEERVNRTLLKFCRQYGVRYFAANECYYLRKEEAKAHDILLCIKEGEFLSTPVGKGRGYRRGMPNQDFYFKTGQEMQALFHDLPQAVETTEIIANKVDTYDLRQSVLLPKYTIPEGFRDENHYLQRLTYQGAGRRYPKLTEELKARIDFELATIKKTGYPGYFLITQDFTGKAREMGVSVGPGRGSAAGSVVAYCLGITNVDPLAYNLLFERFLNPDRISLPDIDIDFDDEGREKAISYVMEKYGKTQVGQIITYGMMGAKSAIRDCARVMELPLQDANHLAKLVPEKVGISLQTAFKEAKELQDIKEGDDLKAQVLEQALVLEGSLRNTSTHACGIIITPCPLDSLVPVALTKDSEMLVTQFDNSVVESAGILKMDFLGLTTLSIINTTLQNIKKRHNLDIDIDSIPLDDQSTFSLYQRGETAGTFQFESDGMQAYLRQLKPDTFEDLIAMNALYRPGPMEYIPNFIARKSGKEAIHYDLPEMEPILRETYGITVYQEQVMLLSQTLAGFSKGDADILRKAMGKKEKETLNKMKDKFIQGCKSRGHEIRVIEKIWKDWEAFAQYAFNKSHSTCYSLIAYQTAYLKAHYTTEYMAAVLTHTRHNIDKITFFIDECKKQNLRVLGPHINESGMFFEVNEKEEIRFGLGAIKGLGEYAAKAIIDDREQEGAFTNVLDLVIRLPQKTVTKRVVECLALSGALDCFPDFHRKQFVATEEGGSSLTEKLIKYASKIKKEQQSMQGNLFGDTRTPSLSMPKIHDVTPLSEIEKLHFEKEVIGVYISGHPLTSFQFELDTFCNATLSELSSPEQCENKTMKIGGLVSATEHKMTRHNKPFGRIRLEDYDDKYEFTLWGDDYIKFKSFLTPGLFLLIEGTVVRKTWGTKDLEFKIKNIELLNELGAKHLRGLQLKISSSAIEEDLIKQLESLCCKFAGECPLYLHVQDEAKKINLELISRKYRVNPHNKMISELKQIPTLRIDIMR